MDSRLRVGLLLDSFLLPVWALAAINRLSCSNHAELALIVLNNFHPKRDPSKQVNHWLYHVFDSFDRKLFLRCPNASEQVDASEIFSGIPVLELLPSDENGKQYFSSSDVKRIESYHLDILVKIGFGNLGGDILSAATHGECALFHSL